ncbi:hypothetical protein ACIRYZ_25410 [Kitasatospora sp. NPDC101155]|uniref:hypothetical protein n=1 Tax=Kitasatospora sp. NPDC101155 TaxID=3364097 RepID=UPI0037FA8D00
MIGADRPPTKDRPPTDRRPRSPDEPPRAYRRPGGAVLARRRRPALMGGWVGELVLGLVVLVGASVQRLAGIGFALVAAPVLVLMLGPNGGVTLANFAAGTAPATPAQRSSSPP